MTIKKKAGRKPLPIGEKKQTIELHLQGKYINVLGIDKIREISYRAIHNEYIKQNVNKVCH